MNKSLSLLSEVITFMTMLLGGEEDISYFVMAKNYK
jgi:hypothetical protein